MEGTNNLEKPPE